MLSQWQISMQREWIQNKSKSENVITVADDEYAEGIDT